MNNQINKLSSLISLNASETQECLENLNEENRDKLIMANLKLVISIAHKRDFDNGHFEDFFSAGVLGLVNGINRASDGYNCHHLKSYIYKTISQEITRCSIAVHSPLSISESTITNASNYRKKRAEMYYDLGREPTDDEMCKVLDISKDSLLFRKGSEIFSSSLNEPIIDPDAGEVSLIDVVVDDSESAVEKLDAKMLRSFLMKSIHELSEKEQKIIKLKFFSRKTNRQIGVELSQTGENVRLQLNRALSSLRMKMTDSNIVGLSNGVKNSDKYLTKM
jgi:RNA polymerase sigma factor (sigma-70 family)